MTSVGSRGRASESEPRPKTDPSEGGDGVTKETRHWDEGSGRTSSMRSKEEAYDYRYFPEPDLVPVAPDEQWQTNVSKSLPVLPAERRERLASAVGIAPAEAATVVTLDLDDLVLSAVAAGAPPPTAVHPGANAG